MPRENRVCRVPPLLTIGRAAAELGISVSRLRRLTDDGTIRAETTAGGHRRYDHRTLFEDWNRSGVVHAAKGSAGPASRALWEQTFPLGGLAEDRVWALARAAIEHAEGAIPPRARTILGYAATELINNAIDHSGGTQVVVATRLAGRNLHLSVSDDGVGAFASIRDGLALPDVAAAVVELTKGKRTTAPDEHAGEDLFFTSKAIDVFDLRANGFRLVVDNRVGDVGLGSASGAGTTVETVLDLDTERNLADVFAAFTDDEMAFVRTAPVVKLISREGEFISRSEAKRFAVGLEKFTEVTLDFDGLDLIGQGFADELFRVWRREHPEIELRVANASPGVALMIGRVDRSLLG